MFKIMQSRFSLIVLLIAIFVILSFIVRVVLMYQSYVLMDLNIVSLVKLFSIGLFYDFVASIFYVSVLGVFLALIPNKIFNAKFFKPVILVFLFTQIYALVFNGFSEYFFWDEFGKRFNFIAVDYLVYTHEVIHNILESYPIPILVSIVFILSFLIVYFIVKKTTIIAIASKSQDSFKLRLVYSVSLIFLSVLFFNVLQQQNLSKTSENTFNKELSKNGFYSLFSAFRNNTLDYDEFYKTMPTSEMLANLKKLKGFDGDTTKLIHKDGEELKYNVMLIMVESLSAEYMGVYGSTRELTPHLDKLTTKSMFFDNFYATGTRTVRGMEAVVLSVVPTPGRSIVKRPDNHNMFSSAFIFKEKGYENKFIYAGHGYFDNMNSFFSTNGFDIVDRNSFEKDETTFSNVWGVCDEDLFAKASKEADKSFNNHKPFFNFIMTTSNHRPFTYPDGKIDIPSHTGRAGGVKYTDYAINKFLQNSKEKPWFKNTLFVIVADHNGGSSGMTSLPEWLYKIPLIIYAPNILKAEKISKVSSQVDLMPTLFSLLNWTYKSKFYGDNILADNFQPRAFIGTYQKLGYLKNNNLLILSPDEKALEYKIVDKTFMSTSYEKIMPIEEDLEEAITYYQSSNYLYKNKLNRWVK